MRKEDHGSGKDHSEWSEKVLQLEDGGNAAESDGKTLVFPERRWGLS